ncbi:hypothetical protein B0H21DRAFT_755620 [Amylocystis lapponica]|nr:hypothetical protein B0H21DRAFT_755620 [Amylocystis lapponica]
MDVASSLRAPSYMWSPSVDSNKDMSLQCQWCGASRATPGVTLHKCAACKIEMYCSSECQRKAWPTHKGVCQTNRYEEHLSPDQSKVAKSLFQFSHKHRSTISEAAILALGLQEDPTRAQRDVLVLSLHPRASTPRLETAFVVLDVQIKSIGDFTPEQQEDLRLHIKLSAEEAARGVGEMIGTAFVMLNVDMRRFGNVAPIGFTQALLDRVPKRRAAYWREWMMTRINEGITTVISL